MIKDDMPLKLPLVATGSGLKWQGGLQGRSLKSPLPF